jgi:septal ring factor EnvC (AmiA/AmiB activator)
MKSRTWNIKIPNFLYAAFAVLLCVFVSIAVINAQTSRRKKTVQPVVSSTPPLSQTVPEIISRAEDIPSENQTIITENLPPSDAQTLEEKIDKFNTRMKEMNTRLKSLESTQKNEYDEKQKRLLLNLDILTRAEQRAESLRKQLYELIEKENSVKTRLEQVEYYLRPEMVERSAAFSGSLRPEEIRDQNKKSLETEKAKLDALLTQIQANRANLEANVQKADALVEKVRAKTEKEIDDALAEDKPDEN